MVVVPRPDPPCYNHLHMWQSWAVHTQYHCDCMLYMLRNLAIRTELGLVDMYSHASAQLMHFHGYVHVSALACLYTFRPRQHHYVPSQPFGIWPRRSDPHCSRACLGFSVFLDPGHGPFEGTFPFVRRGLLAGNFVWLSRFESARSSPCVLFFLFVGIYFSVSAYFFSCIFCRWPNQ